jgi:glutamate-5-semialdehyde dehydrogenase
MGHNVPAIESLASSCLNGRINKMHPLIAGTAILFGGNRLSYVSADLAARFRPGDEVFVDEETGTLLLVTSTVRQLVTNVMNDAAAASAAIASVSPGALAKFYEMAARNLEDAKIWQTIEAVNQEDLGAARQRRSSTTRLLADDGMRAAMIEGLRQWRGLEASFNRTVQTIDHGSWSVELRRAPLGVVGFVFEARPNVVIDAAGVLCGGNVAVLRIGRDALRTALALVDHVMRPALREAGLPPAAIQVIDNPERAAAWALFSDQRLGLAVARGSGEAARSLGGIARRSGIPVSLHGTGGAWLLGSRKADLPKFEEAVTQSLDRKVCNTLNTCCLQRSDVSRLIPALLRAASAAADRRGRTFKLHVAQGDEASLPPELFTREVLVSRAGRESHERQAEVLPEAELGREWEWDETPELSVKVVDDIAHAAALFNRYSPRFVASLISDDPVEHDAFYALFDAPFIGDASTRWVDGQRALRLPELGLANWEAGRLFGRAGILTGDDVFTVRTRARQRERTR